MFYSLRTRLAFAFILLLVIPFVTMVLVLTGVSESVIGKSIERSTAQTMDQYASYVNMVNTQLEDAANQVLSNDVTQQWIASRLDPNLPFERKVSLNTDLRKFLSSIALNHSTVSSITVFGDDGTAVSIHDQVFHDPGYKDSGWYRAFQAEQRRWVPAHTDPYQPNYLRHEYMNSLLYNLVLLNSFQKIGVLKINVKTAVFQDPLEKIEFGRTGVVLLLDKDGHPVLQQSVPEGTFGFRSVWSDIRDDKRSGGSITVERDGRRHLVLYRKLKNSDWVVIGEVPVHELFQSMTSVRRNMFVVAGGLMVLSIGAAVWLSSGIARPLSRLASAMRWAERGDFERSEREARLDGTSPRSEAGYVIHVFRMMVKRIRYLIETELYLNMRRKDAEYKALLMQINPHFLYNTLEGIGSLAVQGRTDEVVDITEALGSMLRYSLKTDRELVKLSEEMQYIRHYVAILRVRFGDRLEIGIREDPSIGSASIVRFILQPLVENAVKFSLENGDVAKVEISTARRDGRLEISVKDNGIGMKPELIDELYRLVSRGETEDVLTTRGRRIGLRNVLARCSLYYGDRFELDLRSEPGRGTSITLRLPELEG